MHVAVCLRWMLTVGEVMQEKFLVCSYEETIACDMNEKLPYGCNETMAIYLNSKNSEK